MNFSEALEEVKKGKQVARSTWGKSQRAIYLVENKFNNISHVEFRSVTQCLMYSASSEDLLANDWVIV